MNKVVIVMYHYVRNLRQATYPNIKALDVNDFSNQLDYLHLHYQVITMADLFAAVTSNYQLPPNAVLLTFDDGYRDHFEYVLPLLRQHQFQGSFFPPVSVITDRRVLDVNKIHFILASTDVQGLTKRLFELVDQHRQQNQLPADDYYLQHSREKNRYDSPEVMLVKRMLQRDLPEEVRHEIVQQLFSEYVAEDEKTFADQLYMNRTDLEQLLEAGMYIGAHGYNHRFLTHLTKDECEWEINQSLLFLKNLGIDTTHWTMCYPYGYYNDQIMELLKLKKCTIGLGIEVGVANLGTANVLALPRLDTKDLPTLFKEHRHDQ